MSQPVHKFRIGNLHASIWKNQSEKGVWYSVIPSRTYKQQDAWKETHGFGFDDLLTVAKLFDLAHTWIVQQHAEAKARRQSLPPAA